MRYIELKSGDGVFAHHRLERIAAWRADCSDDCSAGATL